jgi:RNA polymerase sigma-70 factor (ECF subfamily)
MFKRQTDDQTLMLRFQEQGDVHAFEQLFARHKLGLYRFVLRLSLNAAVAEDVSQHAWLRLIEVAESGRYYASSNASFQTYLFTLARNRYFDEYRHHHDVARSESLDAIEPEFQDDHAVSPEELFGRQQESDRIDRALRELPPDQREVVVLWMQGVELVDVARITGAPWHTIVSRKRYAMAKLKRSLDLERVQ